MSEAPAVAACRGCGGSHLHQVLDLGPMPLADALEADGELAGTRYPLEVVYCPCCHLLQLRASPPPDVLYGRGFPYFSSFLEQWLEHGHRFAEAMRAGLRLGSQSLVVEIGSNDGYLLRHFAAYGIPVLGIDPAEGPAGAAIAAGIPTERRYFDDRLGHELAKNHGRADLIIANNVLAHVPDPNVLLTGVAALLKPAGLFSVEVPYVRDLVEQGEFDTIYHEHHCYFSVTALAHLYTRSGLGIAAVERLPTHGGSIRVLARVGVGHAREVQRLVAEEAGLGLDRLGYYAGFAARVREQIQALRATLAGLRADGARLAAYGAAAKGAVLLNAAGIGGDLIDFVVDRNVHKHGKRMPGVAIPVLPTAALLERRPDYVLLLAWNWAEEVIAQQRSYLEQGGRFVIPIPRLHFHPDA